MEMNIGDVALLVEQVRKRNKKREEEKEKEEARQHHSTPDYSNIKSPYLRARMQTIHKDSQQNQQPSSRTFTCEELADIDDQLNGL